MSKETDMLRKFASGCNENDIPSFLNLHGLRDRVAFAIEAVEAKIAEIVARVEKLEKMGRLGASPNGDDRTRGDMSPRGFDSPTPAAPTPPAPSAVPAPRGFRVGDVVRHREFPGEDWTVSKVMEGGGLIHCTRPRGWVFRAESCNLALVRAADAPEAPAEAPTTRPTPAMELDALRGDVERLTEERDEARAISAATAERVRTETQIATELRKDLDDLRAKLAAAEKALDVERRTMVMCPDGVTPTRRVVDSVEARERAVAEFAREDIDRKNELNALRAELSALKAKPRFRTRKVTAADARALDDEWAKSKYVGRNSWVLAMNALGFRRRVDGAK